MLPHMVNAPHSLQLSSQQLSQTIAQSLYQGMVVLNHENKAIFANATAEMLLGFAPQDLIGRMCHEFLDEEVCEISLMSAGHTHRYTTKLRHADGRVIPATITLTALELGGEYVRLVSISALPHLGPLQDTLMMEQRLAGIGTLTSSIVHELSNPLSAITTTVENLREALNTAGNSPENLQRYVDLIEKQTWRCTKLIEFLRTYARGGHKLEPVALNEVVQNTLLMLADQFRTKWGVTITSEFGPHMPVVTCDANQITQVLINLLTNARDAMQPHGGQIVLKTWGVPEFQAVAFSVRDTGKGIDDNQLEEVFEPFFTTKGKGVGTGLGLFVAAEIIREHKGWIRAQNNPAAGATFTVMLPCN